MADETRNGEKVGADGWTATERSDLKMSCPELEGSSRDEVVTLAARYGTSMPELRSLLAGQPSQGSINAVVQDKEELAALDHYARLRASTAALAARNARS
jgi:hypothetical protein